MKKIEEKPSWWIFVVLFIVLGGFVLGQYIGAKNNSRINVYENEKACEHPYGFKTNVHERLYYKHLVEDYFCK